MSLRNKSKVISQLWIKSVRLGFATPVSSHLKNIMTYRVVSIESGVHRLRAKDLYLNRAREETVFCEKINSYKLFHPHIHKSTATNVFFPIILFFFFFSHNPWSNSWSLSKLSFLLGRPYICLFRFCQIMDFWTFSVPTAYLTVIVMSVTNSLHFRNEKSASAYLKSFTGKVFSLFGGFMMACWRVKLE